jgi:hypothetical protein
MKALIAEDDKILNYPHDFFEKYGEPENPRIAIADAF